MALINHEKKEINAKIVYYGPASSGKTTNIRFVFEKMKPEYRGKLKSLNTKSGNMLFFDFMRPDQMGISGYDVRFHVYTIPGEVADYAIWKTVLKGVDGVIFVADSDPKRLPDNLQKFDELNQYMRAQERELKDTPCLFQCNKGDVAGATTVEEMRELLHYPDGPMIPASAQKGDGVLNSLSTVVKMVLQTLRETPLDLEEDQEPPVISQERQQPSVMEQPSFIEEPESEPESPMLAQEEKPEQLVSDLAGITGNEDVSGYCGVAEKTDDIETDTTAFSSEDENVCEKPAESSFTEFDSIEPTQVNVDEGESGSETASLEITADFAGDIESLAPGHLRLPLVVKFGKEAKNISIDFKMSISK